MDDSVHQEEVANRGKWNIYQMKIACCSSMHFIFRLRNKTLDVKEREEE
jgi:hypothetical protein